MSKSPQQIEKEFVDGLKYFYGKEITKDHPVNKKEETPKPVGGKTSNKLSKSQKRHMRKVNN